MSVKITLRPVGDVIVADLGGSLETATEVDFLFQAAHNFSPKAKPKLLLNMDGVKKVEPAAIRQLAAKKLEAEAENGEVRLENLGRIKDTRTLTQLGLVCPIHDDEAEAVRSFN